MATVMSMIVLPAGQSLRAVAERLGVSLEELQQHAGVAEADRPLEVDRRIEVPDGFLRSRRPGRQLKDAVTSESGKAGGMNMWLALDIEQKRTRAAGGMKAHAASSSEQDALAEARRTYLRLEADANELAIELFAQATTTHAIDVRAEAFAGQSLAFAQRHLLFGDTAERSRAHALSAAKAALLADPKMPRAHVGMALALQVEPSGSDLEEARAELVRAADLGPEDAEACAALAAILLRLGDPEGAAQANAKALAADPAWPFALENGAWLALASGNAAEGLDLLDAANAAVPTYANALLSKAQVLERIGRRADAEAALATAINLCTRELHAAAVRHAFAARNP
jgi:tetratricopeptide (TPR) repeat protein